jgi:hypothetical protein
VVVLLTAGVVVGVGVETGGGVTMLLVEVSSQSQDERVIVFSP